MARINESVAGGANVLAFLDMIARAEIGPAMMADPLADDGYRVLVGSLPGNVWVFTDYDDHPFEKRKAIQYSDGVYSSAAGRYQILVRYWPHYRDLLGLPDFGPVSQDRYAIHQFKERRALDDIIAGRVESAIRRCSNIWASMPGAGYKQREHKLATLLGAFEQAGGRIA
ncbi:glycoside hydrolase family protein [Salinisphaera sp. T31B1]